jgi:hypothetical protein
MKAKPPKYKGAFEMLDREHRNEGTAASIEQILPN